MPHQSQNARKRHRCEAHQSTLSATYARLYQLQTARKRHRYEVASTSNGVKAPSMSNYISCKLSVAPRIYRVAIAREAECIGLHMQKSAPRHCRVAQGSISDYCRATMSLSMTLPLA